MYSSSQAQSRIRIHALQSCCQTIERSDEQEENPLFTTVEASYHVR